MSSARQSCSWSRKPYAPDRLVGGRAAPKAARGRLVEGLPVHHQVELFVGRLDLRRCRGGRARSRCSRRAHRSRDSAPGSVATSCARLLERGGLSEQERHLGRSRPARARPRPSALRSCRGSGRRSRRALCGPSLPDRTAAGCGRRIPCGSPSRTASGRSQARNAHRPGKSRLRWLCAVSISRLGVEPRDDELLRARARVAEHPLHELGHRERSRSIAGVGETQPADADRVLGRHEPVERRGRCRASRARSAPVPCRVG